MAEEKGLQKNEKSMFSEVANKLSEINSPQAKSEANEKILEGAKTIGKAIGNAVAPNPVVKKTGEFLDRILNRRNAKERVVSDAREQLRAHVVKKDRNGKIVEERDEALTPITEKEFFGGLAGEAGEEQMNALADEITRYGQAHPELQDKYPTFDDLAEYYMKEVKPNMKATKKAITTEEFLNGLRK